MAAFPPTNGIAADTDYAIDQLYAWWAPPGRPAPALPEAPASVNVHLQIEGRAVQLTLRDTCETRLLARLRAVLHDFPVAKNNAPVAAPKDGWCSIHGTAMKLVTKNGRSWYSHRTDEGWCQGR